MKKPLLSIIIILTCIFILNVASASILYLDPTDHIYTHIGDIHTYNLYADIDPGDAVMGFGFDLSFDRGTTFVSAPGKSGSYLTFTKFSGNTDYFYYEPMFDDGDTISGWRALFDPDVSGNGIRLGTFEFKAYALGGTETITLGADDLGPLGTEGLVQGKMGGIAFMPNTPSASAKCVLPEPGFILLGLTALVLLDLKRRFGKVN